MDDLAGKLNDLLSSPDAMEKIKSLAGLFGQSVQEENQAPPPPIQNLGGNALGLDGDMLKMVMKMAPLLSSFRQDDDTICLLRALRPLLGEERKKKLDNSIRMMQLLRLLPLLKDQGIL